MGVEIIDRMTAGTKTPFMPTPPRRSLTTSTRRSGPLAPAARTGCRCGRAPWRTKNDRPLSFSRGFGWRIRTEGRLNLPLGGAKSGIVLARPTSRTLRAAKQRRWTSGGGSISAGTPTTGSTGCTSRTRPSARSGAAKPYFRRPGRHRPDGSCHLGGGEDHRRHHCPRS